MAATLADMAKRETAPVRVQKELLRKVAIIAAALEKTVPEYVEECLRAVIAKEFPKVAKNLAKEADAGQADED